MKRQLATLMALLLTCTIILCGGGYAENDPVEDEWIWPEPPQDEQVPLSEPEETEETEMANNIIKRTWKQNGLVKIEDLSGQVFQNESGGHTFVIRGEDEDGNQIALSGSPAGVFLRPDNTDQALTCSISNGMVYATLPAACYDVPGRAGITIYLTSGGQKTALYAAMVSVGRTSTGTVAPGTTADVVDLINRINEVVATIPLDYSALSNEVVDLKSALGSTNDLIKSSIDALINTITINHQETVEAGTGGHVLSLEKPILRGTKFNITNNSNNTSFTIVGIKYDGSFVQLSSGINAGVSIDITPDVDIFGIRSYVDNTDWNFTIIYGETGKNDFVTYTLDQSGTAVNKKQQARENIGAASQNDMLSVQNTVSILNLELTPALTENDNYYYNDDNNAAITSGSGFCYTDPVAVKKGDIVVLTAAGYNTSVSMICVCDENNSNRIAAVYSSNSNVNEYTYNASMDCYLTFSYNKTHSHTLKVYRNNDPIVINGIINENPVSINTVKKFIALDGTKYTHNNYCISSIIHLKKGDAIDFTALCESTVSALSKCTSEGTFIKNLIAGKGNANTGYSYISYEDCYVMLCFRVKYTEAKYEARILENEIHGAEMSFSMFEHWGIIGDSFASGVFMDSSTGQLDNNLQKSWPQILARESGNNCVNFSMGGLYCGSWLSNNDRGLPFLLSQPAKELYIIALGINDVAHMGTDQPLGTISDMNTDYSQNPFTFYGNYGKIIGNIQTHAPKAKIILSTIPYNGASAMQINNAIIAIAGKYGLPCLMVHENTFIRSDYFWGNMQEDHPKSFLYSAMANEYNKMICESLFNDTAYWGDTFN